MILSLDVILPDGETLRTRPTDPDIPVLGDRVVPSFGQLAISSEGVISLPDEYRWRRVVVVAPDSRRTTGVGRQPAAGRLTPVSPLVGVQMNVPREDALDGENLPTEDKPAAEYEYRNVVTSRWRRWVFFEADRRYVVFPILVAVFATVALLGRFGLLSVANSSTGPLLMSVFIAGNFTLISIVVTINQLVISREFGKPHSLRTRNDGIMDFRRDVADVVDRDVLPADPSEFVRSLLATVGDVAEELSDVDPRGDPTVARELERYASEVAEDAESMRRLLERTTFGTSEWITTVLRYRTAWQIHGAIRLRRTYRARLTEEQAETLDRLQAGLRQFGVARQYTQTLQMQYELAELSRVLLYIGVPSLVAPSLLMLTYRPNGEPIFDGAILLGLYALAIAVSFAPLATLLAYVTRISSIVSRLPLVNPFITDG
jgi:hypothetical protein